MARKKKDTDPLADYIQRGAKTKKKTPENWWIATIANIDNCKLATNIGKFANPASNAAVLVEPAYPDIGYVTTQSCQVKEDISGAAQYAGAMNLLLKKDEQGLTLLQRMENTPKKYNLEIDGMHLLEQPLREAVRKLRERSSKPPEEADPNLKQVYFPIDADGTYHLLGILPSSSLLLELKDRLRQMEIRQYECCSPKEQAYGGNWDSIPNQTVIGFGGVKPLNISIRNSHAGGKAYLLPSLPPTPPLRGKTRRPMRDFFREILPRKEVQHSLYILHGLFVRQQNNRKIRESIRMEIDGLAALSASLAAELRKEPPGWSVKTDLPAAQKIWLDSAYEERRRITDIWVKAIGDQFAHWLMTQYKIQLGTKAVELGEPEEKYFKYELVPLLKEEVKRKK